MAKETGVENTLIIERFAGKKMRGNENFFYNRTIRVKFEGGVTSIAMKADKGFKILADCDGATINVYNRHAKGSLKAKRILDDVKAWHTGIVHDTYKVCGLGAEVPTLYSRW